MISCLCITNKRPEMLDRAISQFYAQSFRDKELIILYQGSKEENFSPKIQDRIFHSEGTGLKAIPMESDVTLGALRNAAIRYAQGEYVAQWDDDDWYHPDRLAWQLSCIGGSQKPICMLSSVFLYDSENDQAFRTIDKVFPASIMALKSALKPYPAMKRSEDSRMLREVEKDTVKLPIAELYIHNYHGENAMERSSFDKQCVSASKMPEAVTLALKGYLK